MSKRGQVQVFNRNGPVDTDSPIPDASIVTGERVTVDKPTPTYFQEPVAVAEEASDSEADESNDADGDGHDDDTGQFVEGNTEAADEEEASAS